EIEAAKRNGAYMTMSHPANIDAFEPGALFALNSSNKGLNRPPLRPLDRHCYIEQTAEPRALDWYALEQGTLPFRWSGPNARPKILLPVSHSGEARVALHCLQASGGFAGIEVYQNGKLLPHQLVRRKEGALLVVRPMLAKEDYTVLQLQTQMRPHENS